MGIFVAAIRGGDIQCPEVDVEGGAGITLPLEAAEVIHKRTDGNPFFYQ